MFERKVIKMTVKKMELKSLKEIKSGCDKTLYASQYNWYKFMYSSHYTAVWKANQVTGCNFKP